MLDNLKNQIILLIENSYLQENNALKFLFLKHKSIVQFYGIFA